MSRKKRILITDEAKADLLAIWLYIAKDSPASADAFIDAIEKRVAPLIEHPNLGADCAHLGPDLRMIPFKNYLIFYRPFPDTIAIVHVYHGARDLEQLFPRQSEDT